MSMFGIMRIEKRRRGAVYGLQIEANREKDDYNHGRDLTVQILTGAKPTKIFIWSGQKTGTRR